MTLPFADYSNLNLKDRMELLRIVRSHRTLEDVFAWGRAQSPPMHPADVVKQDEFTHDVIVPFPKGRWVVYGTTCLASVRTVSVWDHAPTAHEILQKRVQGGWMPTPSQTVAGDVVEGYAACMFQRAA